MSINWFEIGKKAVDLRGEGIFFNHKKRTMEERLITGYYSTVYLKRIDAVPGFTYVPFPNPKVKTEEFWKDLEGLLKIDIDRDILDELRNSVILDFSIEISNVNHDIWVGLSPDVLAMMYNRYLKLFHDNVGNKLYFTDGNKLVLLSKPLSEIVDVDEGEWEEDDVKEFIIYPV